MVASAPLVANEAHLLFKADAYAAADLEIAELKLVESISTDFQCDLLLVGRAGFEDMRKIVGNMATSTITGDETPARTLRGLVSRMYAVGGGPVEGRIRYRAQLVPRLWKLRHVHQSRIFQNQSVVDIVETRARRARRQGALGGFRFLFQARLGGAISRDRFRLHLAAARGERHLLLLRAR